MTMIIAPIWSVTERIKLGQLVILDICQHMERAQRNVNFYRNLYGLLHLDNSGVKMKSRF